VSPAVADEAGRPERPRWDPLERLAAWERSIGGRCVSRGPRARGRRVGRLVLTGTGPPASRLLRCNCLEVKVARARGGLGFGCDPKALATAWQEIEPVVGEKPATVVLDVDRVGEDGAHEAELSDRERLDGDPWRRR